MFLHDFRQPRRNCRQQRNKLSFLCRSVPHRIIVLSRGFTAIYFYTSVSSTPTRQLFFRFFFFVSMFLFQRQIVIFGRRRVAFGVHSFAPRITRFATPSVEGVRRTGCSVEWRRGWRGRKGSKRVVIIITIIIILKKNHSVTLKTVATSSRSLSVPNILFSRHEPSRLTPLAARTCFSSGLADYLNFWVTE